MKCVDCGNALPVLPPNHTGGTGYAETPDGKVCYGCCAERDKREMDKDGRICLYTTGGIVAESGKRMTARHNAIAPAELTNWPGTLRFKIKHWRISDHNMAGIAGRLDVWFDDHHGYPWHGVRIGDMDLTRCKRVKGKRPHA